MMSSTAIRAATAPPAMSQGVRSRLAVGVEPARDPQWEQKRAAGDISLPQPVHLDSSDEAPQAEQNFPLSGAPQI